MDHRDGNRGRTDPHKILKLKREYINYKTKQLMNT